MTHRRNLQLRTEIHQVLCTNEISPFVFIVNIYIEVYFNSEPIFFSSRYFIEKDK